MSLNPNSADLNRVCNKCGDLKSLAAFPKQAGCLGGYRSTCKSCMALKTKQWREADPERARASVRSVKERNPDRWAELDRARSKAYRERNPEKRKASAAKYVMENPDIAKKWYAINAEKVRARVKEWAKRNPERVRLNANVSVNNRRARKLRATPGWADKTKIREVYVARVRLQVETGIAHHVDHIIPLCSPIVCGLHVHHNLRVIPAEENWRKHTKLVEDYL